MKNLLDKLSAKNKKTKNKKQTKAKTKKKNCPKVGRENIILLFIFFFLDQSKF